MWIEPYNYESTSTLQWVDWMATPTNIWIFDNEIWIYLANISDKHSINHSSEYYSEEYVPFTGSSEDISRLKSIFEEQKRGLV